MRVARKSVDHQSSDAIAAQSTSDLTYDINKTLGD